MKAYRDDLPIRDEPRKPPVIALVAGAVVVLALLLYFVLRDPAAEAPQQVTGTREIAPPAVVDAGAAATTAPQPAAATANFNERQLDPPRTVVGAGEAPVVNDGDDSEVFVIAGELLEGLEEDAETTSPAQ